MKKNFINLANYIYFQFIKDKPLWKKLTVLFPTILIPLSLLGGIIYASIAVITFVVGNALNIMILALIGFCGIAQLTEYRLKLAAEKNSRLFLQQQYTNEQVLTAQQNNEMYYSQMSFLLKQELFLLIPTIANVVNLKIPQNLSELDYTRAYDIRDNIVFYPIHFYAQGGIDADIAKEVLQNRIGQALSGEIQSIYVAKTVVVNGNIYYGIVVDEVLKAGNNSVIVTLTFPDEHYDQFVKRRKLEQIYNSRNTIDLEDDDL